MRISAPTLAAEHLAVDDGLQVHAETLRRWMKQAGLWRGQRRRKPYRQGSGQAVNHTGSSPRSSFPRERPQRPSFRTAVQPTARYGLRRTKCPRPDPRKPGPIQYSARS